MTTLTGSLTGACVDDQPIVEDMPADAVGSTTTNGRSGVRQIEVTLPVGFGDDQGRIHRRVTLRKMTGRDEALLADPANQRNGGRLVTALLHSCIVQLGDLPTVTRADLDRMYSVDRNYLLLQLRSLTFGPEMPASYTCGSCDNRFDMVEDLEHLPMRTLAEGDVPDDVVVDLEDGYVDRDGSVHTAMTLRLARGADESAVAPQMRKNASLGKNALLSRCLRSLGDVPPHRLAALGSSILADLTLSDRRLIDRAFNQGAPGVELVRELECPSCGAEFRASLDMTHFLALD